ncbi:MAG TPA: carboxy terminal-processing peptidase, partial [Niastella sp.]
ETQNKLPHELNIAPLQEDMKRLEVDSAKLERYKNWLKILRNDPYLDEATNVLNDMVTQTNLVYANVNKHQ